MTLKVAFIGAHGVCKTTLCYELVFYLKRSGLQVDLVKEVARACPLPVNQGTTRNAQLWILCTQVKEELELGAKNDIIVCDRSVLDNYAYLAIAHGRDTSIEAFIFDWLRSYDLLIHVPLGDGVPQADGFRDTDRGFAKTVDLMIRELRHDPRLEVCVLDLDRTSTNWIATVLAHILPLKGRR